MLRKWFSLVYEVVDQAHPWIVLVLAMFVFATTARLLPARFIEDAPNPTQAAFYACADHKVLTYQQGVYSLHGREAVTVNMSLNRLFGETRVPMLVAFDSVEIITPTRQEGRQTILINRLDLSSYRLPAGDYVLIGHMSAASTPQTDTYRVEFSVLPCDDEAAAPAPLTGGPQR